MNSLREVTVHSESSLYCSLALQVMVGGPGPRTARPGFRLGPRVGLIGIAALALAGLSASLSVSVLPDRLSVIRVGYENRQRKVY